MPTSGIAHRIKTGLFHSVFVNILWKKSTRDCSAQCYTPFCTWDSCTEFTYRLVVTTLCSVVFLTAVKCILLLDKKDWYVDYTFQWLGGNVRNGLGGASNPFSTPFLPVSTVSSPIAMPDSLSTATTTKPFCPLLLLLSGDVEQNPGPDGMDKKIQAAIEKLGENLSNKISSIEMTLNKQVSEILAISKYQAESLRRIEDTQREMQDALSELSADVTDTKQTVTENRAEIKRLKEQQKIATQKTLTLGEEIDRLESFSRRNNIKFFGIPETNEDDRNGCTETVTNILKTYIPEKEWEADVIERSHRVGKRRPQDNAGPRPVIAKFQRWGDAMQLMTNRDARASMEKDGLRVTQDLTRRQSAQLRSLREEGKVGYFSKGRLHIRESDTAPTDRQRHRGNRRQDTSAHSTSAPRNPPSDVGRSPDAARKSPMPHVPEAMVSTKSAPRTGSSKSSRDRQATLGSWATRTRTGSAPPAEPATSPWK